MESIKHTYTIQWVGPLSYQEYRDYLSSQESIDSSYFNIYYFEAKQDRRYKDLHRYVGIHKKNDGIGKRLNTSHEHLSKFLNAKELRIWIGSFADEKNQEPDNIDIVETLFIQAYKGLMTENTMKQQSLPKESVCVINMWFDSDEKLKKYKISRPDCFDDVLIYYSEENIFLKGGLSRTKR